MLRVNRLKLPHDLFAVGLQVLEVQLHLGGMRELFQRVSPMPGCLYGTAAAECGPTNTPCFYLKAHGN